MGHPGLDHLAGIIEQNEVFGALQVISFGRSK